jgi:hypothetical protein
VAAPPFTVVVDPDDLTVLLDMMYEAMSLMSGDDKLFDVGEMR